MEFAVLLYQHATWNPQHVPAVWPYQTIEINDGDELPSVDWLRMTLEELNAYKADHQAEYDAWDAAQISATDNLKMRVAAADTLAGTLLLMNRVRLPATVDRLAYLQKVTTIFLAIKVGDFEAAVDGLAVLTPDTITPAPLIAAVSAQLNAFIAQWPLG